MGSVGRAFAAKDLTVGVVYVGARDDFGWNQAHAVAIKSLAEVPGVKVVEEENVPETDAVSKSMESMINLDGAGLILATSFGYYSPFVIDLAKKYPDVEFRHAAPLWNKDKDPKNAGSYFGYLNQAHYVDGVAAGLSTKSNKIGFVAAKPIAIVLSNINSFLLGARTVNPNATVQVIFTGDWSLPVREAEAANALVDAGCDVITCHVDGPKVVIETAEKRGVKTCGHNATQAPLAPKGFITGAEYKWETIYKGYAPTSPRASRCPTSPPAATRSTWCRTRRSAPARAMPREDRGARRDRRPEGQEADLCRSAQGQQDRQGRDRQDLRQSRPVSRQDGLSARGRRRLDDLNDRDRADSLMSNAPLATGASRDLIGDTGRAKAGSDIALEAARELGIRRHPAVRARDRGGAVLAVPAGDRQVADRLRRLVWRGGFGTAFSFQNTLQRSAPLILTALAVAIPARIGLIMIGGEGALVLGGFAAAAVAIPLIGVAPPLITLSIMAVFAMIVGAFWVGLAGYLRYARGVNETISSLLLTYIGIAIMNFFVEGVAARPLESQQAVDHADRRRLHGRQDSRHRRALGLRRRHLALHRALYPAGAHDLRLRGAGHRRQSPRGAGARLAGRPAHRRLLGDRRRLRRARRLLRGGGDPGPRQRFARRRLRLHRHSRRRSSRGTIRSSSCRSRSCSAASSPPAA